MKTTEQTRFENILFDLQNQIVQKNEFSKIEAVTKLYKNGRLVATKRTTIAGSRFKFYTA
ncbi:hypothetical protein ABF80_07810 [Enterobacter hormaechei subsp. steigerwaltii]|nr:hypothetical protein ABF80_07810 [Enterobacter hormaechei subsp. steigerwaltii]